MSIGTFFVTAEQAVIAEIRKILGVAEVTLASTVQHAVAAAKQTDLGVRVMNLVSDLENETMSGAEKMTKLVGDIVGDAGAFIANGGFPGLVVDAEDFARELAQSAYNDFVAGIKSVL